MRSDDESGLPKTWQWPGLWSLNLPVVAILWQVLFARSFHVWLGLYHVATVAALAWGFVAVERWIFFFRLRHRPEGSEESAVLTEQRSAVVRLCLLVVGGLVLVAVFRANVREVGGLLIWTSLGGAYLLGIRMRPAQWTEVLPREVALSIYLSGSVVLFIWANAAFGPSEILLPGLLLVVLFFYYFSLVITWAKDLVPMPSTGALFEGPVGSAFRIVPLCLIFGGVILALISSAVASDRLLLTIGVSGFTLLLVDLWQHSLGKPAARLLADLALIIPLIPLLIGG